MRTLQAVGAAPRLDPVRSDSQLELALRELSRNRLAVAGAAVLLVLLALAAFGPALPLPDPLRQDMRIRTEPPSAAHLLGTDHVGRDNLARLVHGARTSLLVATGAVVLATALGVPLGLLAGYVGGWVDTLAMRGADAVLSFPAIVLAIAIVASLGTGAVNTMLAIGVVMAPVFARLVRAAALSARAEDYVLAARAVGARSARIMRRHVLPSATAPVTVQVGASFALALIAEATLSFLGLGVQAPSPSWGTMLNDARAYMTDAPWLVFFPAAWISLAVLAVNFVGDGLRDALDPRYRSLA